MLFLNRIPYKDELLPQSEVERLPYYDKLLRVRRASKEVLKGFPVDACCEPTRVIYLFEGIDEVAGDYVIKVKGRLVKKWHAWNHDRERGLYIDITQDQFIKSLPEVVILPEDTKILIISKEETERQKTQRLTELEKILEKLNSDYINHKPFILFNFNSFSCMS